MRILILLLTSLFASSAFGQALFFSSNVPKGPVYTGKTCGAFGAPPQTCTWSVAPAIGETIHCIAQGTTGTVTAFALTDNGGTPNTYTANGALVGPSTSSNWYLRLFDTFNIAFSPTTTTISVTGTATIVFSECISTTGTPGASIDGARGTNAATGTTLSTTIAPVASGDFGFCGSQAGSGTTFGTSTTGWTALAGNTNVIYAANLLPGSQSVVVTSTNSTSLVTLCGTYK